MLGFSHRQLWLGLFCNVVLPFTFGAADLLFILNKRRAKGDYSSVIPDTVFSSWFLNYNPSPTAG